MSNSILQQYLDCGLFNIGEDDSRLQVFQQAANDLAAEFIKTPSLVISAVLVAVDPAMRETDPMLDKAEAAVKTHWNTFMNKYQEKPVGLLRPVLFEALFQAADKNEAIASAMWLSGINLTCQIDLGSERTIIDPLLIRLGEVTEEKAADQWESGTKTSFKAPNLELKIGKVSSAKVDVKSLETELAASAGPQHRDGRALEQQNPHWTNVGSQWSHHFAPRAAAGIAKEVDRAIAPLSRAASEFAEGVGTSFQSFGKEFAASAAKWVNSIAKVTSRKAGLLWWKEALYSPSLHCSYRDLKPGELVIAMAQDLHKISSCPSPQSVEYFLRETVRTVVRENPGLLLRDVLREVHKNDQLNPVIRGAPPPDKPQRVSLLTAVAYANQVILKDDELQAWLGVTANLRVPADSLAVWLFRDAQAFALVSKSTGQ
jgi:hypothetical protein